VVAVRILQPGHPEFGRPVSVHDVWRIAKLHVRSLTAEESSRFSASWRAVQTRFVDDPKGALVDADALITEVMTTRGYPMTDWEQRVADISVDYPLVVDHYRTAHEIAVRHQRGEASTEDMRRAMIAYRELFAELVNRRATHSEEPGRPAAARGRIEPDPLSGSSTSADLPPAIRLDKIAKRYGEMAAVNAVSLDVHRSEIFGFLGLNGAGKTTTIRMILDLVRPTAGAAYVFGINCRHDGVAARAQLGYLPGELGFYGDMTGEATLDVLARLNDAVIDRARQGELLERMQFSRRDLRRRIREYSTGMKRKLGIVQAFQSNPPLLILDEPTEGLDPLMQDALYELLRDHRRLGRTVFMSSHVLSEVERVCDRIGLLRRGELVLTAAVADVRNMAARQVRVLFREDVVGQAIAADLPAGCEVVTLLPRAWTLRVRGPLAPLLAFLAACPVEDLEVREPHLEEVVKTYYQDGPG